MAKPEFIPIDEINKLETFFKKGIAHHEEKQKKVPEFDESIREQMKGFYEGVINSYKIAIVENKKVKQKRVEATFSRPRTPLDI